MVHTFSILLVEDDDPLRRCLAEVLAMRGWRVHSTGIGQEAIEIARSRHVDFTILDLHLRGMTGIDVLTKIATEIGPLPSIMMSGQASQEETLAALRAGAFSFLRKPLEMNNLLSTVEQLIRTRLGGSGPRPHFPS